MDLLEDMRSIQSGGSTVETSHYDSLIWSKPPERFEGGLGIMQAYWEPMLLLITSLRLTLTMFTTTKSR